MRVLIIEDDPELATILREGLAEHRVETELASTFASGHERAALDRFDVIVMDVMLPGGDGFRLCEALRAQRVMTPVLMLTARDTVPDRVRGLESGADDYLTKPFAFGELLARVRALARRPPALVPRVARVADLEIDFASHAVRRAGRALALTAKEHALLEILAQRAGMVVSRAEIAAHVWDENHDPFTNVLEALVRRLRRKVDDHHPVKLIHTVRGAGYRLGP